MLRDYGASGRIDLPWTMTSWAGRYVSTTRRGSFASPMCLRDWSTSLSTQCERQWNLGRCAIRIEGATCKANYPDVTHCAHRSLTHDNSSCNACTDQPHWYTFLLPVKRKLHGNLFVHTRRRKDSVTVGALVSCCRIKQPSIIKINALYLHLHVLPLPFFFHHVWFSNIPHSANWPLSHRDCQENVPFAFIFSPYAHFACVCIFVAVTLLTLFSFFFGCL